MAEKARDRRVIAISLELGKAGREGRLEHVLPGALRRLGELGVTAGTPELVIEDAATVAARVSSNGAAHWLACPVWPADAYGVLAAEKKSGKTWAALDLAVAVAGGGSWLDAYPIETSGPVLVFLGEGGERKMVRRLRAVCEAKSLCLDGLAIRLCHKAPNLTSAVHLEEVRREVQLVDELTLMLPGCVEILRETIRSGDEGRSVIGIRSSCNPGGPSHTAIKVNYVEATDYGKHVIVDAHGRSVRYIPAKVSDNPHVGKDYRRTLEAIPDPARRKAMLDGDWSAFGGQFFSEWSQARHIVPRDAITLGPNVRRYCGIDFGYAAPFAAIWGALDGDKRWWIFRELYEKGLSPAEQATGGLSVQESYAIAGLGTALAVNDRISGWQLVHAALADGPLCPYHTHLAERGEWSGTTCPMLHVLDGSCPNLVRTLPDAPYDKTRVEDLDSSCEDHAIDGCRCLIASVASAGGPVLYSEFAGDERLRPLTVQEMGGPDPVPMIPGSPFGGDMRQGLWEAGVSFEREDGTKPGATKRSPFAP
ncbi:MAG: AAA family ATPase [Acidimicrobiales bacterium]